MSFIILLGALGSSYTPPLNVGSSSTRQISSSVAMASGFGFMVCSCQWVRQGSTAIQLSHISKIGRGDGGGRPSSVMSLGVTSVGGHSHGHPASPIGVGSSWEDIDPRSPEPLVVRGGWLWLIWVVRWTT